MLGLLCWIGLATRSKYYLFYSLKLQLFRCSVVPLFLDVRVFVPGRNKGPVDQSELKYKEASLYFNLFSSTNFYLLTTYREKEWLVKQSIADETTVSALAGSIQSMA